MDDAVELVRYLVQSGRTEGYRLPRVQLEALAYEQLFSSDMDRAVGAVQSAIDLGWLRRDGNHVILTEDGEAVGRE